MKCKKKVDTNVKEEKITSKGIKIAKATCPKCGTNLAKIMGRA
jgi:ssDNA-binding Zn-finger/Zn-ribbon topoisomerase 1